MIQSLHILRKDVQNLRPELTVYLGLLATFATVSSQQSGGKGLSNGYLPILYALLTFFLPVCWFFLIARCVHNESLLGDQQFWVTRPYRWTSLFAAKLLFVLAFVALPYLLVQAALLLYADLNPLAAIPGLLTTVLSYTLIVWLPFIITAAVTTTIAQAFMTLLVTVLLWLCILAALASRVGPRMTPPGAFVAFAILCATLLIGTLSYQYATRDTRRARISFIGAITLSFALFGAAILWNASAPMNALVRTVYAAGGPEHLAFDNSVNRVAVPRAHQGLTDELVSITLPMHVTDLPAGERLYEPNFSYTLDTPQGRYTAPWQPAEIKPDGIGMTVSRHVLESSGATPMKMHFTLVATRLTPGATQTVTAAPRFNIPGGNCVLNEAFAGNNTICRFPFENPTPIQVTGKIAPRLCTDTGSMKVATAALRTMPPGTRADPVVTLTLQLGGPVCPGTPLTIVPYRQTGKLRLELDTPPIDLNSFRDQ